MILEEIQSLNGCIKRHMRTSLNRPILRIIGGWRQELVAFSAGCNSVYIDTLLSRTSYTNRSHEIRVHTIQLCAPPPPAPFRPNWTEIQLVFQTKSAGLCELFYFGLPYRWTECCLIADKTTKRRTTKHQDEINIASMPSPWFGEIFKLISR